MKVLVVVPYFDEPHRWMISGQKTAYELSKKHQVVVLTTGSLNAVEQPNPNLKIVRLKDIFIKDPVNYSVVPRLYQTIRRLVKEEQPDAYLINKHMFFTSLAIWPLKKMGKRVIVQTDTFPGINWFPRSKLVGMVMRMYATVLGNPILRAADRVVLLHEELIEVAQKLGLRSQVIHNGIELDKFDATPVPKDLKKPKGAIWIGYVGRLESVKGWDDLAHVAKKLVKKHPQVHFFFAGPTKNVQEIIHQFEHPQIHFLGLRKGVAGLDRLFDIFVMPSHSEGLSNAIMEAMAAGCACVVTDVGGNKVLIKDKYNGLLYPAKNQAKLAKQLEQLIKDKKLRRSLGTQARQTIEDSFDLPKNVDKLAQLLLSD